MRARRDPSDNWSKTPADRPRRRDIAISSGLGVLVLAVLLAAGTIDLAVFVGTSLALASLSLVYYLTALTTIEPEARPVERVTVQPADTAVAELMLERITVPILLIGPGGRIERANPAARAFLGLGGEGGLLSATLRQPRVLEAVSAALRGEKGRAVEYSTLAPIESHVRAFVEPIRLELPGAMPWRAMLVLADDTSSKRAERMRADFLANASHELRTPLASLSGFIETLRGPARDDEEARERFLSIMQVQTERMRRLIDDLLSLSRVEMNEHLPPSGAVDLCELARDVAGALGPVAANRSIGLSLDACEGEAIVHGDRDQLYEVVENLVENALKYSDDGGSVAISVRADLTRDAAEHSDERIAEGSGRLTLSAPPLSSEARYGVLRVRDCGQGIDRRYLPRLSERFFRVGGQKSSPTSGTGLGLAIVKHIVARHRGGFTVESAPGEGSVFSIFFPAVRKSATDGNEPVQRGATVS
jgi:two-component system, OmpR family, phosphate regulon sensor histidine kinase PhoR